MALTKVTGQGLESLSDGVTITTADNTSQLTLKSTDADASSGPILDMTRDSGSPADNDVVGMIRYNADNDAGQETTLIQLKGQLIDASDGTEDATLFINTMSGGTRTERITITPDELKIGGAGGIVHISDVSANDTQKNAIIKLDHYHNSEEDFMGIRMTSIDDNILDLGGGSSSYNAATKVRIYSAANDATTTGTETARFASGKMLVGATASFGGANVGHAEFLEIGNAAVGIGRGDADLGSCLRFFKVNSGNTGTIVGSINVASSSTAYNTSSDYRLKTSVSYDWDATTRLKQLKPARFKWISDGDSAEFVDGLIAHEVATVIPDAVSGAKDDTVDISDVVLNADSTVLTHGITEDDWTKGKSDGTYANDTTWVASKAIIDPQQMDYSKVVTLLVKTIQELEARIATLESA